MAGPLVVGERQAWVARAATEEHEGGELGAGELGDLLKRLRGDEMWKPNRFLS